jgi:hypothetical protein
MWVIPLRRVYILSLSSPCYAACIEYATANATAVYANPTLLSLVSRYHRLALRYVDMRRPDIVYSPTSSPYNGTRLTPGS